MRRIEIDELRRRDIAGQQFQKACWCDSPGNGCFENDHGLIRPFCVEFRQQHDGFRCDRHPQSIEKKE